MLALQQRLEDAGFNYVVVTPMGGDRVFLHCIGAEDIWHVFNDALHFFGMLFNNLHKWSDADAKYERGAWLRVYGVPIHAWNAEFFKLCVMDAGRFVRADECTVEKARLDFARILISTSNLEILNLNSDFIIDGSLVNVKIVEEWGCHLGEDAFLTEVDSDSRPETLSQLNDENGLEEVQGEWELDDLVNDLHKEWNVHEGKKVEKHTALDKGGVVDVVKEGDMFSCKQQNLYATHVLEPVEHNEGTKVNNMLKCDVQQPAAQHGPWSLDWLPRKSCSEGNDVSSPKQNQFSEQSEHRVRRKSTIFKHSTGFLKRIARMSSVDRREILKILKKRDKKRRALKSSISSRPEGKSTSKSFKDSISSVNKE